MEKKRIKNRNGVYKETFPFSGGDQSNHSLMIKGILLEGNKVYTEWVCSFP